MDTLLRMRTGAPGEHIYTADEIASVYDSFGIHEEFVEKLAPCRTSQLTPAEDPDQFSLEQNRLFDRGNVVSALDEDDVEDEDEDLDDDLEEVELEEDVEDVADEDLDDDIDLDLEDDDDDDLV